MLDIQDVLRLHSRKQRLALDPAEPTPDHEVDWVWPAIDTFTDDTVARCALQTCSALGSQRIRLVKIRPGPPDSIIKLDVKTCFLADAGEYTALSYAWGSSVLQYEILVDDQLRNTTSNLWRFLSQARLLPTQISGWLWVDALCIDQTDPWEKLEQVKIISKIFKRAKQTTVWLGPAYADSDTVMKAIANIPWDSSSNESSRAVWTAQFWPDIIGLCERGYWRRLWVFQELRASQIIDVMCGSHLLDFQVLKRLIFSDNLEGSIQTNTQILRQSSAARMVDLTRETLNISLDSMLKATNHLHCADARDKMYALLGTVDSKYKSIEADYTITLPELLNRILRKIHECEEPDSLRSVGQQCRSLDQLFGVQPGSIYGVDRAALQGDGVTPFDFITCILGLISGGKRHFGTLKKTAIDLIVLLHGWCTNCGHMSVHQLFYKALSGSTGRIMSWHNDKTRKRGFDGVLESLEIDHGQMTRRSARRSARRKGGKRLKVQTTTRAIQ